MPGLRPRLFRPDARPGRARAARRDARALPQRARPHAAAGQPAAAAAATTGRSAYSAIFAGGGFARGKVVGQHRPRRRRRAQDPISPKDILATTYHLLGIDPHTLIHDRLNRPFPIAGSGIGARRVTGIDADTQWLGRARLLPSYFVRLGGSLALPPPANVSRLFEVYRAKSQPRVLSLWCLSAPCPMLRRHLRAGRPTLENLLRQRAEAASSPGTRRPKSVIMILLSGGPSHLDMYDMKPRRPQRVPRRVQARSRPTCRAWTSAS